MSQNLSWIDKAGRFGFVAKGAVYAIIGVFALKLSLGDGGAFLDTEGASKTVLQQPFGQVLLFALGVGLACYAAWRLTQAIVDPRRGHSDWKRIAKRIGWAGSGLVQAALAVAAFQTLAGEQGGRSSWLGKVLALPAGQWILVAVGAGLIGGGAFQLYRAYRASFAKKLHTHEMSARERTWAIRLGRFGIAARGVVFPILGWFFIQAGLHARASEAKGTGAALREIAQQDGGAIWLPIVAAGLIAYALYMGINAKYRREFA